ncbi:MAG: hypothetical protein ACXVDW_02755 [Bacteroidia bacterium]
MNKESAYRTFVILFVVIFQTTEGQSYDSLKASIQDTRYRICEEYEAADSTAKDSLLHYSRDYLFTVITEQLLPCWYGTEWNFNGITKIPKQGSIACGIFVTTVLSDAGFNLSRIACGQLASETLIKKLTPEIKRYYKADMKKVIDYLNGEPDGLYIVGLDTHIGFIKKSGKTLEFIHSNYYYQNEKVMAQSLTCVNPLTDSSYRIIGKILQDDMMKKWILNERYD